MPGSCSGRVGRARQGVRVSGAGRFVLTGTVGIGAEPGIGRVGGGQIAAGVDGGFIETGLVMTGQRGTLVRVRARGVGRWLRRRMLERLGDRRTGGGVEGPSGRMLRRDRPTREVARRSGTATGPGEPTVQSGEGAGRVRPVDRRARPTRLMDRRAGRQRRIRRDHLGLVAGGAAVLDFRQRGSVVPVGIGIGMIMIYLHRLALGDSDFVAAVAVGTDRDADAVVGVSDREAAVRMLGDLDVVGFVDDQIGLLARGVGHHRVVVVAEHVVVAVLVADDDVLDRIDAVRAVGALADFHVLIDLDGQPIVFDPSAVLLVLAGPGVAGDPPGGVKDMATFAAGVQRDPLGCGTRWSGSIAGY